MALTQKEISRRYYLKHKERIKEETREYYRNNRDKCIQQGKDYAQKKKRDHLTLLISLKSGPCVDCGHTFHPAAMDFDHRESSPTNRSIGNMKYNSIETILEEVAKCDLRCANCHRVKHLKHVYDEVMS